MIRLARLLLLLCAAFAACAGDVHAATNEPRIALVVGNAAYRNAPPLRNPVNDARDMATALQDLGFDVIRIENGSRQQLEHAIGQFSAKLTEGSVGLFFYSGHGIQVNGHNYLIPVDADLASEAAVRLETVDVDLVLDLMNMAQTRVNLVILDACRSNPFERRFRALGRGLAPVEQAPRGTLVAYSTAPGKVASDGDGANGLYTAELLKAIRTPGLKVEEVFKAVRIAVSTASHDYQTPWEASSLTGDFFFTPPAPVIAVPPPPAPAADVVVWGLIKDDTAPGPFEVFLKNFPNSKYAADAQSKLAALASSPAPPLPKEPPPTTNMGGSSPPSPQTALLTPPAATRPPAPTAPVVQQMNRSFVAVASGNIRKAPSTAAEKVSRVNEGEPITVTGKVKDNNWYRIDLKDGGVGYVHGSLISDTKLTASAKPSRETAAVPLQPPPPPDAQPVLTASRPPTPPTSSLSAEEAYQLGNDLARQGKYSEAVAMLRFAADKDHAQAQYQLGSLYEDGRGTRQDVAEATRLYWLAARQGNKSAQYALGHAYEEGKGAPADREQATAWYRKAAAQGEERAKEALARLEPNSTALPQQAPLVPPTAASQLPYPAAPGKSSVHKFDGKWMADARSSVACPSVRLQLEVKGNQITGTAATSAGYNWRNYPSTIVVSGSMDDAGMGTIKWASGGTEAEVRFTDNDAFVGQITGCPGSFSGGRVQ